MIFLTLIAIAVSFVLIQQLNNTRIKFPRLPQNDSLADSVSVVIPCYNEEKNIRACIQSVFQSIGLENKMGIFQKSNLSDEQFADWKNKFELIVVNDGSNDSTSEILEELSKKYGCLLSVINTNGIPEDPKWRHKNWACHVGAKYVRMNSILFIDADVRLKEKAIFRSLHALKMKNAGLISVAPEVKLNHWAEKLVQPIMSQLIALVFGNADPKKRVFAAGPFMHFSRKAYHTIGGHEAVKSEIVEDVALGTLVSQKNLGSIFHRGYDIAALHMYDNLEELWEGWTKNIFLGLEKDWKKALAIAGFVIFYYFFIPLALAWQFFEHPIYSIGLLGIYAFFQIKVRNKLFDVLGVEKDWAAFGSFVGSIFVVGMIWSSYLKTTSEKGWTWKNRQLSN